MVSDLFCFFFFLICFANILLRIFASKFIKEYWPIIFFFFFVVSWCSVLVSGWPHRMKLYLRYYKKASVAEELVNSTGDEVEL